MSAVEFDNRLDESMLDDDHWCHVKWERSGAWLCGLGVGYSHEPSRPLSSPPSHCSVCGKPTCPDCMAVWNS